MAPQPTEQLAELMRTKRRVLEQLHQVGVRQGELVSSGDVATLLKLLSAKQRLLAGLQAVEKGLEPFRDEDPDRRPWPTPEHRAACAADADACRKLLASVVEMERVHEQAMTERRDDVASRLKAVHQKHEVGGAYQAHRAPSKQAPAPVAFTEAPPAAGGLDLTTDG